MQLRPGFDTVQPRHRTGVEAKEKAKKTKLAEKEAKEALNAAKKLDDKIQKRKTIGGWTRVT